jgi:hypothetical protein
VVGTLRCADVDRVADTIDVCIFEQESHRQNKMKMRHGVLTARNMEIWGAIFVCLPEQLRPLLRSWTLSHTSACALLLVFEQVDIV